jgi:hypothetical protein
MSANPKPKDANFNLGLALNQSNDRALKHLFLQQVNGHSSHETEDKAASDPPILIQAVAELPLIIRRS